MTWQHTPESVDVQLARPNALPSPTQGLEVEAKVFGPVLQWPWVIKGGGEREYRGILTGPRGPSNMLRAAF